MKFTPPGGKVELVVEWNEPEGQQAGQGGNRRPPVSSVHTSAKRWVNVLHTSEEAADTERGANPDSSLVRGTRRTDGRGELPCSDTLPTSRKSQLASSPARRTTREASRQMRLTRRGSPHPPRQVAGSDASASLEAPAGNPEHERRNSIWKPVSLLNRFLGAGIRLAPGHGPVHSGSHIVFRVCDTGIGVPPHQMVRGWSRQQGAFPQLASPWVSPSTEAGLIAARPTAESASLSPPPALCGLSAAQERIFQPFVQADTASNRQYQGTGLGLTVRAPPARMGARGCAMRLHTRQNAHTGSLDSGPRPAPQICRKVAHAMNGTLTLSSKVGEGSEFTLTIPVTAVEEGPHRRTVRCALGCGARGLFGRSVLPPV